MAEYLEEISYSNLLNEKLHQILLDGDKLKYGEILYTTGTPNGIRWSKELYEQKREFYGEKFLAKYIVNGEFLKDLVEADIADFSTEPYTALTDANNAYQAYKKVIIQEAIEQLKQQNIKYDYNEEYNDLIINITAEEFIIRAVPVFACFVLTSGLGLGYWNYSKNIPNIPSYPDIGEEVTTSSEVTTSLSTHINSAATVSGTKTVRTTTAHTTEKATTSAVETSTSTESTETTVADMIETTAAPVTEPPTQQTSVIETTVTVTMTTQSSANTTIT